MRLRFDPNNNKWNRRHTSPLTHNIVELALIVGNTGTHLALQSFHWQDLHANINLVAYIKGKMFHKQIIRNKRILTKLDLHRNSFFDKIRLV